MTSQKNRRDFLSSASAATLGALAAGYPSSSALAKPGGSLNSTADTVIVLWMGGGIRYSCGWVRPGVEYCLGVVVLICKVVYSALAIPILIPSHFTCKVVDAAMAILIPMPSLLYL